MDPTCLDKLSRIIFISFSISTKMGVVQNHYSVTKGGMKKISVSYSYFESNYPSNR